MWGGNTGNKLIWLQSYLGCQHQYLQSPEGVQKDFRPRGYRSQASIAYTHINWRNHNVDGKGMSEWGYHTRKVRDVGGERKA